MKRDINDMDDKELDELLKRADAETDLSGTVFLNADGDLVEGSADGAVKMNSLTIPNDPWPAAIAAPALYGLAGDVVRVIEPHTEADPVALLIQFLVAFGNCIGRGCHWRAESDEHHGNIFAVLVGKSAKGRKGTAWGRIRYLFNFLNEWIDRCKGGLSSGEGLIWQVRDAIESTGSDTKHAVAADEGVADKRLMLVEPEFAQVLKQTYRAGNTLSTFIRHAWDRGDLQSLTKNSPAKASGAHISIVGHITKQELLRYLTTTEAANGFANRFLWVCVRRSKFLPNGGNLNEADLVNLTSALREASDFGRGHGLLLKRDAAASELWHDVYKNLTAEREGLAAAACGRAEAQVMRLAMLYALLDRACDIGLVHLKAALELWRYCEESADAIFGTATGDPTADDIAEALRNAPAGLTRTEIRDLFSRHQSTNEIGRALSVLLRAGHVRVLRQVTVGRPIERWIHIDRNAT